MQTIAHRGGMGEGMQNTPKGVRLAVRNQVDLVELDVVAKANGAFYCVHGWSSGSELRNCLAELGPETGLILHLKGTYDDRNLLSLADELARHLPMEKVVFAAHGSDVLRQLRHLMPEGRLARFGLPPALAALWKQQPWEYCLVNQLVLSRWHVLALQRIGYKVFASCVWEFRGRRQVERLGVDGAFVNLY